MSVDTTSYYYSLTSDSTDSTDTDTDSDDSTSLSSDDFITILCAQLEYQDPTDPVDTTAMVDQMTQYAQLAQLTDLNEKMDTMTDSMEEISATYGLDYLGKSVEAEGSSMVKDDDDISDLYLTLDDDAAEVTVNIYNSTGTLVDTETFSDVEEGTVSFSWDGTDSDGEECDDGTFYVTVEALDSDGDDVDCTTTTSGTVSGVSITDDGVVLALSDGRTVNMSDVTYVQE